jgi:hypothetical protein
METGYCCCHRAPTLKRGHALDAGARMAGRQVARAPRWLGHRDGTTTPTAHHMSRGTWRDGRGTDDRWIDGRHGGTGVGIAVRQGELASREGQGTCSSSEYSDGGAMYMVRWERRFGDFFIGLTSGAHVHLTKWHFVFVTSSLQVGPRCQKSC